MENEQFEVNLNERVGFGTRLGAYLIDTLIVLVVGSIIGLLIGDHLVPIVFGEQLEEFNSMEEQFSEFNFDFMGLLMKFFAVMAGIPIVTIILFILEGSLGQSIGKMMLRIVNTNVDGSRANAGKLWLRSFLKYGSSLLSIVGSVLGLTLFGWIANLWGIVIFVGFFLVFLDNKQTIHDMIAKTVVSST
jgi:uncharacterized RDD family membrane protein YckC